MIESKLMQCERCEAGVALSHLAPEATDPGRFEDYARKMYAQVKVLENRQARLSDSALIRKHGGGGLLVWHVDSTQIAQHGYNADNSVNAGPIHGLALVQADNRGDLDAGRNRGDGGDPYPGTASNLTLSLVHAPFPVKNVDGSFAGFSLDSIWQIAPNSTMAVRVTFGSPTPAAQAVIDQLLIGTGLAPTDQTYLDLSGNRNAQYDVGDFLAWVNRRQRAGRRRTLRRWRCTPPAR